MQKHLLQIKEKLQQVKSSHTYQLVISDNFALQIIPPNFSDLNGQVKNLTSLDKFYVMIKEKNNLYYDTLNIVEDSRFKDFYIIKKYRKYSFYELLMDSIDDLCELIYYCRKLDKLQAFI